MLPLRPPAGKPASLVCTYAATGHNSAVLSLDVTEDLMFTGSKGELIVFTIGTPKEVLPQLNYSKKIPNLTLCCIEKQIVYNLKALLQRIL